MRLADVDEKDVVKLLARFSLRMVIARAGDSIPGSYWGEDEAGLIGDQLFARSDTPLHSILHEACHWIVMDPQKRQHVHTDASDSIIEENATCYLQILLADYLPRFARDQALQDMDAWGYSFRLGSARAWFEHDAVDARNWLLQHGLIDGARRVLFCVRR
jgi:hypothetical protein